MKRNFSIHVSGRVQGVFFRASTLEKARELGIAGFVRNEKDGSVYIEAEGGQEAMDKFLAWCAHGPMAARVDQLKKEEGTLKNFTTFEIVR